jgi:hypothetical protein
VPELPRRGDELARARHGFRGAGHHPLAPGLAVVLRSIADQPRLVDGVVEHGFVEIEDHRGGHARQLLRRCVDLLECRRARRGIRDAFGSEPVDLLGGGAVLGSGLHPQRGVELLEGGVLRRVRVRDEQGCSPNPGSTHESSSP